MIFQKIFIFTICSFVVAIFSIVYFFKSRILNLEREPIILSFDNFGELNLRIYYMDITSLTPIPINETTLIEITSQHRLFITGERLKDYLELLEQLNGLELVPIRAQSNVDVRFLYIFETRDGKEVFRISMWGKDSSILVNGIEVENNAIFYDVIKPFLSEEILNKLEPVLINR